MEKDICYIFAGSIRVMMKIKNRIEIEDAGYMPDFGCRIAAKQMVVNYGNAPCGGEVYFEVS